MAHHRTDVILKKLYYIHTICSDAKKKPEDTGEKKDSFKAQKDKIAGQIREAKTLVNERDQILAESGSRADAAKKSQAIREIFKTTETDIEILKRMQVKKAQKYEGKEDVKEETTVRLEREKEIVDYAYANLQKAKDLERYGKAGNPNREILNGSDGEGEDGGDGRVLVGSIPDLDDVDFQDMRAKDKQIDDNLEELLKGITIIHGIARDMGEELQKQDELLDKMDDKVEKARVTLVSLNTRMTSLLKKTRGPRQCCCDVFLILLILAVAAAIIFLVT